MPDKRDGKCVNLNLTVPENILKKLDRLVASNKGEGRSRSDFVSQMIFKPFLNRHFARKKS